ncbi:MAG: AsmA family protein [Candidatus Omnitrophica bacterium]|nr:AsmA family protein [Candidatus Omnitrophota bacterium]
MNLFWKIFKIIVISLAVLVFLGLTGAFIFLKNFDIKQYKPQIIKAMSQSLDRVVDFDDIQLRVSLQEGVRFKLTALAIKESPAFGTGNFVSVGTIELGADIIPFLTLRQISIPNILVRDLQAHLIRNKSGVINAQTIGPKSTVASGSSGPGIAALPVILINSLKIEDAQVEVIDQSGETPVTLAVKKFNFTVKRFSLDHPFEFLASAAVLGADKNLEVSGKARLDLFHSGVVISDLVTTVDFDAFALNELRDFPLLKGVPLPKELNGQVKAVIKKMSVSDKGLENAVADIAWTNGKLIFPEAAPGISIEANKIDFKLDGFYLDGSKPFQVSVRTAVYQDAVNVDFSGQIGLDLKKQSVHVTAGHFATDLNAWPLEKMKKALVPLKTLPLPKSLTGKIDLTIKNLEASPAGVTDVLCDAALTGGEFDLTGIVSGIGKISKTDVTLKDLSLNRPFAVSLKTALFSQTPDIAFDGDVALDLTNQAVSLKNAAVRLDLDVISFEQIKKSGFIPAGTPFPQTAGGQVRVDIKYLAASAKGLDRLKTDIHWQDGKIRIVEVAPGVSVNAQKINVDVTDFSLQDPFAVAGSLAYENDASNISFKTTVDLKTSGAHLTQSQIDTDLSQLSMERLKTAVAALKNVSLPSILAGKLSVAVKDLTAGPQGIGDLSADVRLTDGVVKMDVAPGVAFAASKMKIGLDNVSLTKPFAFTMEMAYLGDEADIKAAGTASLDIAGQAATINDARISADLSKLSLTGLKSAVAALKDVPLPEKMGGQFDFSIAAAQAGAKGLIKLDGKGTLKDGLVKVKELGIPVEKIDAAFQATQTDFILDSLTAALGQGQITVNATVNNYLTTQDLTAQAQWKDIDLAKILDQDKAQVKVEGLISGQIKAQGKAADLNSVTGDVNITGDKVKLKDINVLKTVLDKISFIPNVSENIQSGLPDKYKTELSSQDTDISSISLTGKIANSQIVLDPIRVEADAFIFTGKSTANFQQEYDVDGNVKIPAELSAAMVKGVSQLQYLYDENNYIAIPVHAKGKGAQPPSVSVTKTAVDMTKSVIRNKGKEELQKVLEKALGGAVNLGTPSNTSTPDGQPTDQPAADQPANNNSPAGQIIDQIFGKILK